MTAPLWTLLALAWLGAAVVVAGLLFGLEPREPEPITPANAADATPRWALLAWPAAAVLAIAFSVLYPMGVAS